MSDHQPSVPSGRNSVILLVEDSEDDVELARLALNDACYPGKILVARDGSQALDMLFGRGEYEGNPTRPEVILLDLTLPALEGLALLEWIRSHPEVRLTPVVVFSSSDDPEDIRNAYDRGANGYVRKPVRADAYADTIRCIVEYWHGVNKVVN